MRDNLDVVSEVVVVSLQEGTHHGYCEEFWTVLNALTKIKKPFTVRHAGGTMGKPHRVDLIVLDLD